MVANLRSPANPRRSSPTPSIESDSMPKDYRIIVNKSRTYISRGEKLSGDSFGSLPPLQLRRKRKAPRAAAGAADADEDRLLLLLAKVGALQHLPRLLLEQVVQR